MSINPLKMLSGKVQAMEESATIRMAQKARDLAAKGVSVISLSLGEPDFDTPEFIKEAAYQALKKGNTKYTPVPGTMDLRKAICDKFETENNLHFEPSQIVVSNGAKQSIANICLATLDEGDEAIILAPYWVSYVEIVKFAGGVPVVVSAGIEDDFKVNAAQIREAITEKTKLLIFSSPCNPTGSVYTYDELEEMADVIGENGNILIIADEIYEYINFTGKHASIGAFEKTKNLTATVNGFSKGFSMTGWRLGYMGGPKWLADACNKVQGQVTSGAASFSQAAATVALKTEKTEALAMKEAFLRRRDLIIAKLKEVPGLKVNQPQGAFYVFPDISHYFGTTNGQVTIKDADDFSEAMLTEAHVGTVSGAAFGNDQCIRLSYAASDADLIEAVSRIKNALASFKKI
ncbi:MAG: pyridoxal phosphate-dependent aminotransferase [Saprospiraceae bacterium]|nr:pyridoxal phosphate-dependent aminotransferase [Saprospiraceae bacterium]MBK9566338.1 pyridoxal phosphate-dependent aminotransferase [Saprospiraceae bacterium]MBP6446461.1 pyridoxal phosphate-dependent aminotransferase [Saprospiraceae bacterium]